MLRCDFAGAKPISFAFFSIVVKEAAWRYCSFNSSFCFFTSYTCVCRSTSSTPVVEILFTKEIRTMESTTTIPKNPPNNNIGFFTVIYCHCEPRLRRSNRYTFSNTLNFELLDRLLRCISSSFGITGFFVRIFPQPFCSNSIKLCFTILSSNE